MKRLAWCVVVLGAMCARAEWKFQVTLDGTPVAARVTLRKVQDGAWQQTPCLLPNTNMVRGASLFDLHCEDPASSRRLAELARKFKPSAPVKELETDEDGRASLDVKGEFDVLVSVLDVEASGRFRVDTSVGVETKLMLHARTREEQQTWDSLQTRFGKKAGWLVAAHWPDVVSTKSEPWSGLDLPPGRYLLVSDDGAWRLSFSVGAKTGEQARNRDALETATVTRGGKPVGGAEVVAADRTLLAREKTDAKGTASYPGSYGVTLLAFAGTDCAVVTERRGAVTLALKKCELQPLRVVDPQGTPVRDAVVRFKLGDDRRSLGSLSDGRLFVPAEAKEVEVVAPGFLPARPTSGSVTLTPFHRYELHVRTHDGLVAPNFEVSEDRRHYAVVGAPFYETDLANPRALISLPGRPPWEVPLNQAVTQVTLPELETLEFPLEQELIAPSLRLEQDNDYVERRNRYSFWKQGPRPPAWVRSCVDKRCSLTPLGADAGVNAAVTWQVSALRADGGVSRGGSVELKGGAANEEGAVRLDQVGVGTAMTSPGWFWMSGDGLAGRWCRAGERCVLRAEVPAASTGTVVVHVTGPQLEDVVLTGAHFRAVELEDGVAEVRLPAGSHQLVLDGTTLLNVSLDAGQRLELQVALEAPRDLDFEVRGTGRPVAGVLVELVADTSGQRSRFFTSDSSHVHLEGWRPGNVPLLVSAPGYSTVAVDGRRLDGGVTLTPSRHLRFDHHSPEANVGLSLPVPDGYPPGLWRQTFQDESPLSEDAGVDLPAGAFITRVSVQQNALGWLLARQSVSATATAIDAHVPRGGATVLLPTFGAETDATLIPGAPLSAEELRTGGWFERTHAWCLGQFREGACGTAPLPPGPATVILEAPRERGTSSRGGGDALMWRIDVPDAGILLLTPPPNATIIPNR